MDSKGKQLDLIFLLDGDPEVRRLETKRMDHNEPVYYMTEEEGLKAGFKEYGAYVDSLKFITAFKIGKPFAYGDERPPGKSMQEYYLLLKKILDNRSYM